MKSSIVSIEMHENVTEMASSQLMCASMCLKMRWLTLDQLISVNKNAWEYERDGLLPAQVRVNVPVNEMVDLGPFN